MASFKSLLLALMLALMAAYNASCYILANSAVIWTTGETLEQGTQRLEDLLTHYLFRLFIASSSQALQRLRMEPHVILYRLNSVGRFNPGQEISKVETGTRGLTLTSTNEGEDWFESNRAQLAATVPRAEYCPVDCVWQVSYHTSAKCVTPRCSNVPITCSDCL
ncbi:uncharacterized protein UDID_19360 [Ustilago sp. UG-2017a]|nr:uncharacterized protein UDID_19360 [Ustilago sp. UG-2017a]